VSYELMKQRTRAEITSSEMFLDAVMEVAKFKQMVPNIRVRDEETRVIAAEVRGQMVKVRNDLETMRKQAGEPYRLMLNTINAMFKPKVEAFKPLLEHVDGEMAVFEENQKLIYAEEQKKAAQKQIEASNIAETTVKAEMMTPQTTVDTNSGKTFSREDVEVEIVNPIKFVKAVLDGRNTIPMRDYLDRWIASTMTLLKQHARGDMYAPDKWAKYGVKVTKVKKYTTRTT